MAKWSLADAENIRNKLTKQQQKEIAALYRRVYTDAKKRFDAIPKDGTTSQQIQKQYLDKLIKQLEAAYNRIGIELEQTITGNMKKAASGVVQSSEKFSGALGLSIEGAYSFVPDEIVSSIAAGKVYSGRWSLSSSIWADVKKHQKDINTVVAEGVAANKSAYDIAKDLEKYVNPAAEKPWDWSKVYPGTSKKVDYNAQRLARTLVSHSYQQSLERVTKSNPFVSGYIWHSGHSDRVCEICQKRDGKFFAKGKLPLDHPNGMCTFTASMEGSMTDMADRLADWANGKEDPALDKWADTMFPKEQQKKGTGAEKKPSEKGEDGLTDKQRKKAKEWDEAYERVVEFAKSQGEDVNKTVSAILGKPPVGSKHYKGASDSVAKTFEKPKKTVTAKRATTQKKPASTAKAPAPKRPTFTSKIIDRSRKEANEYISNMIKKQGYSKSTLQAIEDYTMFSDDINGYLRGLVDYDDYVDQIRELSKAMKTGVEEAVYRGCDSKTLGISPTLSEQEIRNRLIGREYRDKGFLSTTLSKDVAKEFSGRGIDGDASQLPTIITMRVSKDIGKVYVNSGLGEVLLNKGSKMHFVDAQLKDGVLHVTAEVY